MTNTDKIQALGRRLVGDWTTEATHPGMPGEVVNGTAHAEWVDGEKFLMFRTQQDHKLFPNSVSILGDTDGLHMHYFDERGVHRVYDLSITDDGWEMSGDVPEFLQRVWFTFTDDDTMSGTSKVAEDRQTWTDDLAITYHRSR